MTAPRAIPNDLTTRPATEADLPAIEVLHAMRFGPGRFTRTAYRLREGVPKVSAFCRVAESGGRIVGAIRFTRIRTGGIGDALLLGPLAVTTELTNIGIGVRLVREGLDAARNAGIRFVLLVGDVPYYGRFGFETVPPDRLIMPGPVNPGRLLGCQLLPEDAEARQGRVRAER